jgi:hypothetical protein
VQFRDARLKIDRANKHIADLESRIGGLPDHCVAAVEINTAGGNEVIKYDLPDTSAYSDIALMLGDAVHNLRCALDYAWIKTLERVAPQIIDHSTKFPVRDSADELKTALHGAEIDTRTPGLFNLVVSSIKPYKGGNFAIWPLHKINNTDKHRLLIPLIQYGGVIGLEVEDETGKLRPDGYTWGTTQPFPYYVAIPYGWHVKKKGKVAISILFDEAAFGDKFHALDSLRIFSGLILQVVECLERFCEA